MRNPTALLSLFLVVLCSTVTSMGALEFETTYTTPIAEIFPNGAQSSTPFDVVDVRGFALSNYEKYVLTSVEGIVNKEAPRLYIVDSDMSSKWLPILNASPYLAVKRPFENLSALLSYYQGLGFYDGQIIFDGDDPDAANIASPLSGIYHALLVPSQVASKIPGNLPVEVNVTHALLGLTTRAQKYRYALEHYFPLANQSSFAMFGGSASRNLRAFIVANDLFTLWQPLYVHTNVPNDWGAPSLDPDPLEDRQFFEDFLALTPTNIPIWGYMWPDGANEGVVIKLVSAANKYLIPSDWVENLPFLDQMILPDGYEFLQQRPAKYPTLENKVYATGIWSDGDNIQYVYGFMKDILWDSADVPRGQVPTGWTVNPSAYVYMPYVLKYFYENASPNDYFVGGLSGKGYCKPDYFTDRTVLTNFLAESQVLYEKTDLTEARVWQVDETGPLVANILDVKGIFDGYGGSFQYRTPRLVNGMPIVLPVAIGNDSRSPVEFIKNLRSVNSQRPLFIFFHLHCWSCRTSTWTEVATQLAGMSGVEVIRPDAFMALVAQWKGDLAASWVPVLNIALVIGLLGIIGFILSRLRVDPGRELDRNSTNPLVEVRK